MSNDVSVLLGTGTGSFGAKTDFPLPGSAHDVGVGDFNRDAKQDLAVAVLSNAAAVVLGTGTGSFGAATGFPAGALPFGITVGDFNGDTNQDLVVSNNNSHDISVLLGTGTGSFGPKTDIATNGNPKDAVVGDFNGDGKQDLAVANVADVSVFLGTGTGAFGSRTGYPAHLVVDVAVGDFNGDGKEDLAVANANGQNAPSTAASVLLGTGTGSFGTATDFTTGTDPRSIAVGDFNGDGNDDLATGNNNANTGEVSVLLGNGSGEFGRNVDFAAHVGPRDIAASDFNRDGRDDLAVANEGDDVSVLLTPAPVAEPSPRALAFPRQARGTVGPPRTATIANRGASALRIRGFSFGGTNPGSFLVGSDTCRDAIPPGGSCAAQVRFAPRRVGQLRATMTVLSNGPVQPTVALAGTGTAPPQPRVTCTVKKKPGTNRIDVTCRVTLATPSSAKVRWRLVRGSRTYAHGVARVRDRHAAIDLRGVERLPRGRYVLRVAGRRGGVVLVVPGRQAAVARTRR